MTEKEFDSDVKALRSMVSIFYGVLLLVLSVVTAVFIWSHEGDYARITTETFVYKDNMSKGGREVFVSGNDVFKCVSVTDSDKHSIKTCRLSHVDDE